MRHGKVTHRCQCYLHRSHSGSSHCGSDVLKGGLQVFFFICGSKYGAKKRRRRRSRSVAGWSDHVPMSECTHATSDCPQSDCGVHQQATTAGLTYISYTHTHVRTHTSVPANYVPVREEKPLKQHLDQHGMLSNPA